MAAQSSTLYANNIRHMIDDLTPEKDGVAVIDMEDDVIRGALVTHRGEITWPPPPPKIQAIAAATPKPKEAVESDADKATREQKELQRSLNLTGVMLGLGGILCLALGAVAPPSFMQHFIVFVLSIFIGFHVIWGVSHSLHTPLMAITNAISSIIIVGALLQVVSGSWLVMILASIAILIASVNIFGGFLVTRRMLAMFQRS
jgi:NAD(P) transhydrogenase subunit alpha